MPYLEFDNYSVIDKVCHSVFAYIAGNLRDTKSCSFITHVNFIASNKVIEDIFDYVIHACVDTNPHILLMMLFWSDSFKYKWSLWKRFQIAKLSNQCLSFLQNLLWRKHLWKFRATEMYAYTFISLLFIRTCRNQIKYNFLSKKNQTKIWSEQKLNTFPLT